MKLVAIVRTPDRSEEAAHALAEASGIALAEARMRLAPEPPALLARLDAEAADRLVARLRRSGLAALAVSADVPTDRDRTVVRSFSLHDLGLTCTSRSGAASMRVAWPDLRAVFRGLRASRSELQRTEKSRSFSVGAAVATGGLKMTRTSERTVRTSQESTEQVILAYARDGRVAVFAERELDFSSLGPRMQPSSTGNMLELARLLRERARSAFHDDRLLRLGRRQFPFLAGGESRSRTATTTMTRSDTSGSLDALAEVMRQAVEEDLLP